MANTHIPNGNTPPAPFTLGDFCIDEYEPIKVIVIGAGFSGLLAGIRFPQKIPNVQLTIYEKGAGVGGTWYNNNYPGLACDVAAHCYQYSFEEKRDWTSFYATGPEIRSHLEDITDRYKLMRYIKLQHEVVHAQYDVPAGQWHVRIRRPNPDTGAPEEFEDSAHVLVTAVGLLSRWKWPDIEGLHDFKGELLHSAGFEPYPKTWQEVAEPWADKNVGVIGVGSSAIQIVSALQPKVGRIVNYARGKTWLVPPFARENSVKLLGRDLAQDDPENLSFSPEEIERFKNDPKFAREFRCVIEEEYLSAHSYTIRGTPLSLQLKEVCQNLMKTKLAKKPWMAENLMPDFPVSCRRLTPGPGYLEALCADNGDLVSSPIKRVTEKGIETVDGKYQDMDVIICATGYDTSYQLPFKIIGKDGVDINERWKPHPTTYLSVAVDGYPNMFLSLGPNSAIASGTLISLIEYQIGYAVQATAKLQRERLKSIEVKAEAVKDFDDYIEAYFPKTVFADKCRSWYKLGKEEGRVVGLWPGSTLHGIRALMHPRWEDFSYERADPVKNRLNWLGDGQTYNEKTLTGDSKLRCEDRTFEYVLNLVRSRGLVFASTIPRHPTQ
ncbi:FAD/NAD-P-binding domain-containing protein [Cubamyces menziesii]|nr:FAD/NAD-P-binding domain-containing protein [Cubamyces menziesii]